MIDLMNEKLRYLKKYNKKINLLSIEDARKIDENLIPIEWRLIIEEDNFENQKKILLLIWAKYIRENLINTIEYLYHNLIDIDIIEFNNKYSILYTIKNTKGSILYYEGKNPLDENNTNLNLEWTKIPIEIRTFYNKIHNGFYYYASESMGFISINQIKKLSDDEFDWSIIHSLKRPLDISLDSSITIFTNGMGSYLVIDLNNCENKNGVFWSSKMEPVYNIDFWKYADEWFILGFES